MASIENGAKRFKYKVLKEVSLRAFEGRLDNESPEEISNVIINKSKSDYRCCVYKEKEIIKQTVKIACGVDPVDGSKTTDSRQIVRVIKPACNACTINRVIITDNCRKCIARSCQNSCNSNAIHMEENRAVIDYNKCIGCGLCAKNCSYNAIAVSVRPCMAKCPVEAITYDEDMIAKIDDTKCINCGTCEKSCPFGAIEDISWMVDVIDDIKKKTKITAIFAPSIQGQYNEANINQIKTSLKTLGFTGAAEVAIGADAVSLYEFEEFKHFHKEGKLLTTSCCPAFLNLAKSKFPKVYEQHMSTTVSPMVALARYLKKQDPESKVCFIGPCVAKKQEANNEGSFVDYVLSYQELGAMFASQNIIVEKADVADERNASIYGRNFAIGKGVSAAVAQVAKEQGYDKPISLVYADGCLECKKNLMLADLGKLDKDLLEGMSCVGGCINGPVIMENSNISKARMAKENDEVENSDIYATFERYDFSDVDMHRKY